MAEGHGGAGSAPVHVSVRVRPDLARRLDTLAASSGLSRSQFLRLVLARVGEGDVPRGLVEHAAELRAARAAR